MRRKAIFCVLIVVALCLGAPAAFAEDFLPEEEPAAEEEVFPEEEPVAEEEVFPEEEPAAEEIFIEESAPAPEEEIFYEEPDPDETQDPSIDEQLVAEEIFIEESAPALEEEIFYEEPVPDETQDSSIDDQLEEEIDLIDAEPELTDIPSFLFQTPEDMTITFGVESQSVGFASVSDVTDIPAGARILLHIDDPAIVNVDDADETIPLSITDADGNDTICLWDETMGARTVELFIHVSDEDWARAALGSYAATINYRAAVE